LQNFAKDEKMSDDWYNRRLNGVYTYTNYIMKKSN